MRRHLRWIVPLTAAPLIYIACALALSGIQNSDPADPAATLSGLLGGLALAAVGLIAPIVLVIVAIVQATRVHRDSRHRRGQFTHAELAVQAEADRRRQVWESAAEFRQILLRREVPPVLQQWELVPYPGEVFFHDAPMTYARYYGQDVPYTRSSTLAFGHPTFVMAALAASAIGNAASRSSAEAAAREQWREWQTTRVLVSNARLVVWVSGQWLSFDYAAMSALYPEVQANTFVCQFASTSPLMLQGPHSPFAAIMSVFAAHGEAGLAEHPQLRVLDPVARG